MADFFDIAFEFFENIGLMMENLYNFLFQTITIGTRSFKLFYLIIGGTFTAMLISWLIGKIIGRIT